MRKAHLLGQSGLHTTRNRTCCWARMQARKGPVGPQGSTEHVCPVGLFVEELERATARGVINQCGRPSASEVGLNLPHRTCASAPPLVPGHGTNWY